MNLVTINEVKNSVNCSGDGKAEHVFNIKNTSNTSLKIGCQILQNAPTQETWLTVTNVPSYKLEVGTIAQISVKIAVPEDSVSGNYSYRLRIFDTNSPGERFSDSHAVYFNVAQKNIPESIIEKKCSWCVPTAIAAALLFSAAITSWFLIQPKILVPDLTNMTFNKAIMAISKNQLGFDETNNFKTIVSETNINKVVKQDPPPNVEIEKGAFITIWLGRNRELTKLELQLTDKIISLEATLKRQEKNNMMLTNKHKSNIKKIKKQTIKQSKAKYSQAMTKQQSLLKIQYSRDLANKVAMLKKQQKQALINQQLAHKNKISTIVANYGKQQQKLKVTLNSMKGLNKFIVRLGNDATNRRNKTKNMIIRSLTNSKKYSAKIVSVYNNRAIYFRSFLRQLRSIKDFNNKRITEIIAALTNQQKILKELNLALAQTK